MSINKENWPHTYLSFENLRAQVHEAHTLLSENIVKIQFCVTVFNQDTYQDIFQRDFESIDEAIECINSRYPQWKSSATAPEKSGSGCDSCQAH